MTERSVLSVRGRDAQSLLHNVSSTDLGLFDNEPDRAAVYAGFLSVKGKLMYDGIICKPKLAAQTKDDTEFWIDVCQNDLPTLQKNLRKYAMRKNVKIEDISHIIKPYSI